MSTSAIGGHQPDLGPDAAGAAAVAATDESPDAGLQVVASYDRYADAQRAVDALSDRKFPVEALRIVGSDLQLVEAITGRLTKGRAALAGAASGAMLGLLFGLLVGLFTVGPVWLGLLLGGLILGAFWGAMVGFLAHWATGGRRDFASTSMLAARHYDLVADARLAVQARQLLAETH